MIKSNYKLPFDIQKTMFTAIISLLFSIPAYAQQTVPDKNPPSAIASSKEYKALYVINQGDEKKIRAVVRNINNALEDPRLKGKMQVELVVFGDGVEIFKKENHYDTLLLNLKSKGIILAQCENTLKERKIGKEQLWPFISFVPSGNGEMIIKQYEGWAVVHP